MLFIPNHPTMGYCEPDPIDAIGKTYCEGCGESHTGVKVHLFSDGEEIKVHPDCNGDKGVIEIYELDEEDYYEEI